MFRFLAICVLSLWGSVAIAQNENVLAGSNTGAQSSYGAADFVTLIEKKGYTATLESFDGELPSLIVTTQLGGKFLISFMGCKDAAAVANCEGVAIYVATPNAGVSFFELNEFNGTSYISRAINVAEANVVILGFQRFFSGGVTPGNVNDDMDRFLNDIQTYFSARANNATSVSFTAKETLSRKLDNKFGKTPSNASVNSVYNIDAALRQAVGQPQDVRFIAE